MNWMVFLTNMILVFGHVIWFLERNAHKEDGVVSQFPRSFVQGGHEGVWWALVTTTTVGYGDKHARNGIARLFTAVFMAVGFVASACVIGSLASALSTPQFDLTKATTSGLGNRRVCTYPSYIPKLVKFHAKLVPLDGYDDVQKCMEMLVAGTVDAVVYDAPMLLAMQRLDKRLKPFMIGQSFDRYDLGPAMGALAASTPLVGSHIEWALAEVLYDPAQIAAVRVPWFGDPEAEAHFTEEEEPIHEVQLIWMFVLWGGFFFLQILGSNIGCMQQMRDAVPETYGIKSFLFGDEDERNSYKTYVGMGSDETQSCQVAPAPEIHTQIEGHKEHMVASSINDVEELDTESSK